jgi:hypothetical protein
MESEHINERTFLEWGLGVFFLENYVNAMSKLKWSKTIATNKWIQDLFCGKLIVLKWNKTFET